MPSFALRFVQDQSGATAIEYGLIAAMVAVVIVTAVTSLGNNLSATYSRVVAQFP
jgi:pilus assembly protein Flp/PilA